MIFDTHAHYDDDQFDKDRYELIESLPANGVEAVTDIGASFESCKQAVELANKYDYVYAAVGIHPSHVHELDEEKMEWLEKTALTEKKVVAIGETGLDYYWNTSPHEVQKMWFVRQIELAKKVNLPLVIHAREASQDTFDLLKEHKASEVGGVIHCYSGSAEMAKEYVKMGFFIGVGGVLTFKNSKTLKDVVDKISLEHIVIETDSPYLAPVPYRSKRNCSIYLTGVVKEISRIKGISEEEVIRITCENAKKLYRLEV